MSDNNDPILALAQALEQVASQQRYSSDIKLAQELYSESERRAIYASFGDAVKTLEFARQTLSLSDRFSGDQRTEEQYAEAHGKAEARRAATSRDQAVRSIQVAEQAYISLQNEHPTLYRVYKRR